MDVVEGQVQKHLVSFCKILPAHVNCWRSVLQESVKSVQTLGNLWEQHRHVTKAKVSHFENFDEALAALLVQIATRVEEELVNLKELINKLNKCTNDLKNKLLTFERSTLNLDWEQNTELIKGNGSQPSLERLLQSGLAFLNFFTKNVKNISERFKALHLGDDKSIREFQASFDVNLEDGCVTYLIALTQYVDDEKAIL